MTGEKVREMSNLVIVRHGEYGRDMRLNAKGRDQMYNMAEILQGVLARKNTAHILSSTAPRALDSAKILSEIQNVPIEEHELLWSESGHPEDLDGAYGPIKSLQEKADLGIVVTHLEYAESLPPFLLEKEFNKFASSREVRKGEGVLLDYRREILIYLK